jgi:Xaa-Pro aminopeptidase
MTDSTVSLAPLYETLREQGVRKELAFPEATYAERLARTRAAMEQDGLDAYVVVHNANQVYLHGYDTHMTPTYSVTVVPPQGDLLLHTAELESPVALLHSVVDDVRIFDWTKAKTTAQDLADVLREIGAEKGRIGIELRNDENFTMGAYDAHSYLTLREELPQAEIVDATHIILEQRLRKSPEELAYMRKAGEMTWAGLQAAIEATYEGCSENVIAAGAYHGAVSAGSELMSIDPMLMTGSRTGLVPHIPYRRHVVNRGDMVYLEMTGTYWRYNAPSMRSWVVGEASDRQKALAEAAINVLETVIAEARPGRTGHEVAMIAEKQWASVPGVHFHGGYGYGIGMCVQPTWCEQAIYIAEGADRELEPGMTFHLPMVCCFPNDFGLGFSESIVITETGAEVLTPGQDRFLKSA